MSRLAEQMESVRPLSNAERLAKYRQKCALNDNGSIHEHTDRIIKGEMWRRSLYRIPHAGASPSL